MTTTYWCHTAMTTDTHIWAGGTGSCLVFHTLVKHWRGRQGKLFLETMTSPRRHSGTPNSRHGPHSHYSCSLILSLAELLLLRQVFHLFLVHGSLSLLRLAAFLHQCVGWLQAVGDAICTSAALKNHRASLHSKRLRVIQSWGCDEEEDNGT